MRTPPALLLALLILAPTVSAGWTGHGQYEPDTPEDVQYGAMYLDPDQALGGGDQVYLQVFPTLARTANPNVVGQAAMFTPQLSFHALLGVWKDCNRDGAIGWGDNTAFLYRSELLVDTRLCPILANAHNDGHWVREFLPIVNGCGDAPCPPHVIVDPSARIWGDDGRPGDAPATKCPLLLFPEGTLRHTGRTIRYLDCPLEYQGTRLINLVDHDCSGFRTGIQLCFHDRDPDAPEDSESSLNRRTPVDDAEGDAAFVGVFSCNAAYEFSYGGTPELRIPAPDVSVNPDGTVGGSAEHAHERGLEACDGDGTERPYDVFAPIETDDPTPTRLKSSTDWEFVSKPQGLAAALSPHENETSLFWGSMDLAAPYLWRGARADPLLPLRYVHDDSLPETMFHATFYAKVSTQQGLSVRASSDRTYGGECPPETWQCDPYLWWNGAGPDTLPHRALVGALYNLLDVDCVDLSLVGAGVDHGVVSGRQGACQEPLVVPDPAGLKGFLHLLAPHLEPIEAKWGAAQNDTQEARAGATGEEDVDDMPEELRDWLENLTERERVAPTLDPHALVHAVARDAPKPHEAPALVTTLAPVADEVWTTVVDAGTDAVGCAKAGLARSATRAPGAVANCTLQTLSTVAQAVEPLAMRQLRERAPATMEALPPFPRDEVERVPVVGALLPRSSVTRILPGALDLGPMPEAPNPWSRETMAQTPLARVAWGDLPLPQVTRDLAGLGMTRTIYGTLRDADDAAWPIELIGTLDAAAFNVLVLADGQPPLVAKNTPLGTTRFIHLGNATNADAAGADLAVRATLTPSTTGQLQARVDVERKSQRELHALVAAFVQVPNSRHVLALGLDARPDASGETWSIPDAMHVEVAAPTPDAHVPASYALAFGASPAGAPTRPLASLLHVAHVGNEKVLDDRLHVDVAARVPRTPASLRVEVSTSDAGATLASTSADRTPLGLGVWHHDERPGHVPRDLALVANLDDLPRHLRLDGARGPGGMTFAYTATDPVARVGVSLDERVGDNRSALRISADDWPASLRWSLQQEPLAMDYAAATPPGRVSLGFAAGAGEEPACLAAEGVEYLTVSATERARCVALEVRGLHEARVTQAAGWTARLARASPGDRLLLSVDAPQVGVHLDAAPWPAHMDATARLDGPDLRWSSTLSEDVRALNASVRVGTSTSSVVALDVPRDATVSITQDAAGARFSSSLSGRLGDLSLRYARDGAGASLGADDGVMVVRSEAGVDALALRLRGLADASFRFDPAHELNLTADTTSSHPFHVRYVAPDAWISTDIPRLPAFVDAQISRAPDLAVSYRAAERIENVSARLAAAAGPLALELALDRMPREVDARVNASIGSAFAAASEPLTMTLTAGPAGVDVEVPPATYTNALAVERPAAGEDAIPRIHLRLREFELASARAGADGFSLDTRFRNGSGPLTIRYGGPEGWLHADVPSGVPPHVGLALRPGGATWTTEPPQRVSTSGAAAVNGLDLSWRIDELPARVDAHWNATGSRFDARVTHDALNAPRIHLNATLPRDASTGNRPALSMRLEDVPPDVRVNAARDGNRPGIRASAHDAEGRPATIGLVEIAYTANDATGFALPPNGTVGARAFLRDAMTLEAALRLRDVASLRVTAESYATARVETLQWASQADAPLHLDVLLPGESALHVRTTSWPRSVDATLRTERLADARQLSWEASSAISWATLDWTSGPESRMAYGGALPPTLTAKLTPRLYLVDASEPFDASFVVADGTRPSRPIGGDHVMVRADEENGGLALSVRLAGLKRAQGSLDALSHSLEWAGGRPLTIDIAPSRTHALVGTIGRAPSAFRLSGPLDQLHLNVSEPARDVDLALQSGTARGRLAIDASPTQIDARIRPHAREILIEPSGAPAGWTLELAYAGDGQLVPGLDRDGLHLDAPTPTLAGMRFAARVTDLARLEARAPDPASGMHVALHRTTSGDPFDLRYRAQGAGLDVKLAALPANVTADVVTRPDGIAVRVDGGAETLGATRVRYADARFALDANASDLPSAVLLELTRDADGRTVATYDARAAAAATTTDLHANATTSDGYGATLRLVDVPPYVTVSASPANGHASLTASGRGLTGELVVAAQGARAHPLPSGMLGATLGFVPGNEHVHVRADGLLHASWTRARGDGETHDLVLRHATPHAKPFRVAYDDGDTTAYVHLGATLERANVTIHRDDNRSRVHYDASGWLPNAILQFGSTSRAWKLHALLDTLPQRVDATLHTLPSHGAYLALDRSWSPRAPSIHVDAKLPGGVYARGNVEGIPENVTMLLDPARSQGRECVFDLRTSGAISRVDLRLGSGTERRRSGGAAEDQRVAVNLKQESQPAVDLLVRDVGDAGVCDMPDTGFLAKASLAGGNVTFAYETPRGFVRGVVEGLNPGETALTRDFSGFMNYTSPGNGPVGRLVMEGTLWGAGRVLSREVRDYHLEAVNVPPKLSLRASADEIAPTTYDSRLGALKIQIRLQPSSGGHGKAPEAPTELTTLINLQDALIELLSIEISDGPINWPTAEGHRVLVESDERSVMALNVTYLSGGSIRLQPNDTIAIEDLRLEPRKALTAVVKKGISRSSFSILSMPNQFSLWKDARFGNIPYVRFHVSDSVDTVRATIEVASQDVWDLVLTGVPAGASVSLGGLLGAAVNYFLTPIAAPGVGAEVAKAEITHWLPSGRSVRCELVETSGFRMVGDFDGVTNAPHNPVLFYLWHTEVGELNCTYVNDDGGVRVDFAAYGVELRENGLKAAMWKAGRDVTEGVAEEAKETVEDMAYAAEVTVGAVKHAGGALYQGGRTYIADFTGEGL